MSALEDTQPMSLIDIADAMSRLPEAMSADVLAGPSQDPQLLALP